MDITPVHTTLIPQIPVAVKGVLQENLNPALQRPGSVVENNGQLNGLGLGMGGLGAFDTFEPVYTQDARCILDAIVGEDGLPECACACICFRVWDGYTPQGLASGLKPAYFASASSPSSSRTASYRSPPSTATRRPLGGH